MKRLYQIFAGTAAILISVNVEAQLSAPMNFSLPANTNAVDVSAAEYYLDTDPGLGNGTHIPITAGSDVSVNNVAVNISGLATGIHRLYLRTQNTNGLWSLSNTAMLFITPQGALIPANENAAPVSAAEYYLDTDPGLGNGTPIPITAGSDISVNSVSVNISSLALGVHRLYVRTQNTNGEWSITNVASFYIAPVNFSLPPNAVPGDITALEYFFDTDPGFGNGTMVSVTPTTDLSNYTIAADISSLQLDTTHTFYIRALDGWSQTTSKTFTIGIPLPIQWLSFTGKLQPDNSVLLQWQVADQDSDDGDFKVERSSDGKNFSTLASVASEAVKDPSDYTYTDVTPLQGNNFYRIRQTGMDGKTLYSTVILIHTTVHTANDFYVINNPARSILRVHTGNVPANAQLQIMDMEGRALMQVPVVTGTIQQIDLSQMATGTYIIRYISQESTLSKKFIKQ